jgi:hypothetical protein
MGVYADMYFCCGMMRRGQLAVGKVSEGTVFRGMTNCVSILVENRVEIQREPCISCFHSSCCFLLSLFVSSSLFILSALKQGKLRL